MSTDLTVRVDRKGGSCSDGGTDQRPNTPRSKHSATEQRRRSKINDRCFDAVILWPIISLQISFDLCMDYVFIYSTSFLQVSDT